MMSADRSIQVGIALLGVGCAAFIARVAYVWTASGQHLWDLWAILSAIVGSLGLVIMLGAWIMPTKESASPGQVQTGGHRSTNIQAGRDISLTRDDRREG
jgi:hypothetical protein